MNLTPIPYDALVQRLQQSFGEITIYGIDSKGQLAPWFVIDKQEVLTMLIINTHMLREQVDTAALWMAYWGRLVAATRRAYDVAERDYRDWRSRFVLKLLEEAATADKKKPTEGEIESRYRSAPEYALKQTMVEQTQEANLFCDMVYQAHRARINLLTADVRRAHDGTLQRNSV